MSESISQSASQSIIQSAYICISYQLSSIHAFNHISSRISVCPSVC